MTENELAHTGRKALALLAPGDLILFGGLVLLVTRAATDVDHLRVVTVRDGKPDTLLVARGYDARFIGHVEIDRTAYP
jgi:hypothetical protein